MHLISIEGENNKCYIKVCVLKVFKNSIKLLASPFLVMFRTVFTRRTLKGKLALQKHLKGTWALGNLRHSGTRRLKGHLGTQALKAHGHLGTQALKGHLGT